MVSTQKPSPNQGPIFDIYVTGKCDMQCPFCYGADKPLEERKVVDSGKTVPIYYHSEGHTIYGDDKRPEMSLSQVKQVMLKLRSVGLKTINISGGEPLIREDIDDLILFAHEQGLEVYLSTNGTLLLQKYDRIKDHLLMVGLPLDGSKPEINTKMGRKPYHFKNIRKILEYFKQNPPGHQVKIGTILSKINLFDLESTAEFLYRNPFIYPPDVWRLYQFDDFKASPEIKARYEVSDDEFFSACESITKKFPDAKISKRSIQDSVNAYFIVTPDGIFQTFVDKPVSVADFLAMDVDFLKKVIYQDYPLIVNRTSWNRNWLPHIVEFLLR